MLTSRGWWILLTTLALLLVGLWTGTAQLVLMCLTLLSWLLGSWLIFVVRLRLVQNKLSVERELRNDRGPVRVLWAGQHVEVVVRLVVDSLVSLPWVWIVDRLPALARLREGTNKTQGFVGQGQPLELAYWVDCPGAGRLRFEGLYLQIADLQGFFQSVLFVRSLRTYRVFPAVVEIRGQIASKKKHNILPLLGTHRHRRPGSGSELLDLRDYLPGDPPKMIAWKASARRDRLMTKEFESEVPVRCTLFVDVSSAVRIGRPGENVLARLVEIAAAVVQTSARVKDLTGVCLFDEDRVHRFIRPGRGARHVRQVLSALTDVADLPVVTDHGALNQLLPLAFGLAQEVYPDLLDPAINVFPFWLPWWSPQPGYTQELPSLKARSVWEMPWVLFLNQWRKTLHLRKAMIFGRLSFRRRRQYRWRKLISAILAQRYDLGPGGLAQLLEDDDLCRRYLQRFLCDHQVAFPVPLYDGQGRYLLGCGAKIDLLVRPLLNSVTRGRDNELFVLIVDALEAGPKLTKLLRAVQVARARHHRVMLICPWPKDVALPGQEEKTGRSAESRPGSLQELFFQASSDRLRTAGRQMQRAFARLGVPMLFSPDEQSVPLILHHMQQLRLLERGGP